MYRLTECNVPRSQVLADPDGRDPGPYFMNSRRPRARGARPARLSLGAPGLARPGEAWPLTNARTWETAPQGPTERARLSERARQDRATIVCIFTAAGAVDQRVQPLPRLHRVARGHRQVPERGADRQQHRVQYLRKNPRHRRGAEGDDFTGRADEGAPASTPAASRLRRTSKVVVTHFSPVKKGQLDSPAPLRNLHCAAELSSSDGDEFVFERSLGRPRNSVVCCRVAGISTALSIPAVVRQTPDGLHARRLRQRPS